jgi:hypothetical protein
MLVLQEKPDEVFKHVNGTSYKPVATLKEFKGFTMHIYEDDEYYAIAVPCNSTSFVTATHICPEAHEVLRTLPSLANK